MRILLAFLLMGALLAGGYAWQRQNAAHRLAHAQPATQTAAPVNAPAPAPAKPPAPPAQPPESPALPPASGAAAEAQAAAEAAIAAADRAAGEAPAASDPALTLQGYDPARVGALIAGSALPETRKTALNQALRDSATDPARLPSLLEQIRTELP